MKKPFFFAVATILFTLVSCQEKALPVIEEATDPVFKAGIVTTRTTVNSNGKIRWEEGDEVSITDASSVTVTYVASDVNGGSATLKKKAGESGKLGNGPYTAVYGSDPSVSQTYSAQAPSLPMKAVSSSDTFRFIVTCGLLELNLTKADESIKSIAVSDGTTTYTLTCNPAVSIGTGSTFYLAVPAAKYTTFTFTNANDKECVLDRSDADITVSGNTIQPVSFATSLVFTKTYPAGTLDGVFSVAEDRQVRFSKGNLQYQASTGTWRFAEHQYDVIGDNPGNSTTENRDTQTAWIDLFGWGATGRTGINENLKQPYYTGADYSYYKTIPGSANASETLTRTNGGDWGICMGESWRLLTKEEWSYLLSSHTKSLCVVSDASVYGLLIMPDGWSGTLTATIDLAALQALETAGGVFFPAGGRRDGTNVIASSGSDAQGYYWSSNAGSVRDGVHMSILTKARNMYVANGTSLRNIGMSVRLVVDN